LGFHFTFSRASPVFWPDRYFPG